MPGRVPGILPASRGAVDEHQVLRVRPGLIAFLAGVEYSFERRQHGVSNG